MATLSSLWMKRPIAFTTSASPVSSVIARSNIERATSSLGHRPLSCSVLDFATLMILPGAAKGAKPAGGVAASDGRSAGSAADAVFARSAQAEEARAAEVPRKPRRETDDMAW